MDFVCKQGTEVLLIMLNIGNTRIAEYGKRYAK